jgi:hypothetical protein
MKIFFSPKKSFLGANLFLGALFTKVIGLFCTFLKSVRKDGFFDTLFDLITKNFSSYSRVSGLVSVYFL